MNSSLRPATADDAGFLRVMLYERTGFRVAVERERGESTLRESVTMKFELRGLTKGSGAG
jgi:hypothetical protein